MAFWNVRRATSPSAVEGSAARSIEPQLEPVQIFLRDGVVRGHVSPDGERLTDLLANQLGLRAQLADGTWSSYSLHDIVIVAPPPHASGRRIHRSKHRVELAAGPYTIIGTAHLPPGTQLNPFVLRTGRPVLPVTNAWVRADFAEPIDQQFDVAIVVVKAVDEVHGLFASM